MIEERHHILLSGGKRVKTKRGGGPEAAEGEAERVGRARGSGLGHHRPPPFALRGRQQGSGEADERSGEQADHANRLGSAARPLIESAGGLSRASWPPAAVSR